METELICKGVKNVQKEKGQMLELLKDGNEEMTRVKAEVRRRWRGQGSN